MSRLRRIRMTWAGVGRAEGMRVERNPIRCCFPPGPPRGMGSRYMKPSTIHTSMTISARALLVPVSMRSAASGLASYRRIPPSRL